MPRLLLSPRAIEDLEEIYEYTFVTWGLVQADRYQDDLFDGMEKILEFNDIGRNYTFSNKDYRYLPVNKHLIFYRFENHDCIIVRVLHERMNLIDHMQ